MENNFLQKINQSSILINPDIDKIYEHILQYNEGEIGLKGAAMVDTGIFTGRSPKDKYFVEEEYSKDNLWWGPVNKKINSDVFDRLYSKISETPILIEFVLLKIEQKSKKSFHIFYLFRYPSYYHYRLLASY